MPDLIRGSLAVSATEQSQRLLPGATPQAGHTMGHTVATHSPQQYMQAKLSQHEGNTPNQPSGAYKIEAVAHDKMQPRVGQPTESKDKSETKVVFQIGDACSNENVAATNHCPIQHKNTKDKGIESIRSEQEGATENLDSFPKRLAMLERKDAELDQPHRQKRLSKIEKTRNRRN